MEGFLGAHLVRLRCDVRGRGCNYLTADEDARGVRFTTNRQERASIWAVEFSEGWALFRSDYGGYLSAAKNIARTGGRSGVVLAVGQHPMPVRNQAPPEMLWRAARREGHVVLRNRAGGYLRANGRYLRWSTAVSVAEDDTTPMMMWTVEVVPLGLRALLIDPPALQGQVHRNEIKAILDMQSNRETNEQSQEKGTSISLSPPPVPQECELASAGIVPERSESEKYYVVIALYARGSSSLFGHDEAFITTCSFYPKVTKWKVFDNKIDFSLKEGTALARRWKDLLLCLKQGFLGLSQTTLDASKI
nr:unnamed protein product [Digitaria exilis]